jgi:hypothetical protein
MRDHQKERKSERIRPIQTAKVRQVPSIYEAPTPHISSSASLAVFPLGVFGTNNKKLEYNSYFDELI